MASNPPLDFFRFFQDLDSPHIILRADKDLTVAYQNSAHAKISMVEEGVAIGKPVFETFPDTTKKYRDTGVSDLHNSFLKVIKTGKSDRMPALHYNLQDSSGNTVEKWWRVSHHPLFDESGKVAYISQSTEDITDAVVAKRNLKKTQELLSSALEVGLVSTWSWDMNQDVVKGDENLAKSFGVTKDAAAAGLPIKAFLDSIHPDDQPRIVNAIDTSVKTGAPYSTDYRTLSPEGKLTWVIARGKVTHDESGKPEFFNGILIDITARKEAELNFSTLFNSNIVAIAKADTAGAILDANGTFLKLFGYTKADLKKGMTSKQVSAAFDDGTTQSIYDSLKNNGESSPVRKRYKRKDGSQFTGLVGAAMLPDESNAFIAFILDVSETEKLKELNLVKDEFIAMASHQLRTPASTVKQYLHILLDGLAGPLNSDQEQYITIANSANERQIATIEDLLKTAIVDVKGFDIKLTTVNIVQVVQDVVKEYKPAIASRSQNITFTSDKPSHLTKGDAAELESVFANLIENASKYSKPEKNIDVSIKQKAEMVQIQVRDQGVGIKKEDYVKVFEKFTRIDNPLSDTVTGTGLGMYWVKRVIQLHNGSIELTSTYGKGTTFTIKLPV